MGPGWTGAEFAAMFGVALLLAMGAVAVEIWWKVYRRK